MDFHLAENRSVEVRIYHIQVTEIFWNLQQTKHAQQHTKIFAKLVVHCSSRIVPLNERTGVSPLKEDLILECVWYA